MAQTFRPSSNNVARISIVSLLLLIILVLGLMLGIQWTPYVTRVGVALEQPVQFSHRHHVQGLGISCQYCHTSVEDSSFAGIPPTSTCMTCHSQVWTEAPILEPVRQSYQDGSAIPWQRVHNLPDFVYFDHSIHINKGIGCNTCHGAVDQMHLVAKAMPMTMQWCLDCHRAPEKYIRPVDEVFNMTWQPPANQIEVGRELIERYNVQVLGLTNCSVCHR